MNSIITAAAVSLSLLVSATAQAGDAVVFDSSATSVTIADAPRGFVEIDDPMHVLQPYLADDMVLPRQQVGHWIRPQLTAARVESIGEHAPPTGRKDTRLNALKSKFSDLPEPPMASMLLIGLILLFLTVQDEKGEKFTEE
jgi:hypothetical protein